VAAVVLREVTLLDGSRADVVLAGSRIERVVPAGSTPEPDAEIVDLTGHLLLPAAVEPHAHLDKAFLADVVTNETGDLLGAIEAMTAARGHLNVSETLERAERAARLLAANGVGLVRTHADTTLDHGLISVEAMVQLRERVADVIDVEVVALCGWPVAGAAGADQRALLLAALDRGADVVGGCPHLEDGGDTRAATEALLTIAADRGTAVDLHTDEVLDPTVLGLVDLAELVSKLGFPHPVTASHCVSLGLLPVERQHEVAEAVAAAGISVVALPATNLFLHGRGHQERMPRAVTAVSALREGGVNVAAGADNLQDPFNPLGRVCPFETAGLMVMTTHVPPAVAWAMVSDHARVALGRPPLAVAAGQPADLLAVPASSVRQAIAMGPARRRVWHDGRPVGRLEA
jgi:cytosine/creatinine deaminase